jgi:hypothetical protein
MRHQTATLVRSHLLAFLSSAFLIGFAGPTRAQFLIVGNDNKKADGIGKDTIAIFSIHGVFSAHQRPRYEKVP